VVEDRQRQRLEHHAFSEAALHRKHRGSGEVKLALGIAIDITAKTKVAQVRQGVPVEEFCQRFARGVGEPELGQNRPVPATTPYRRPSGSRRANSSNVVRRSAVPSRSAADSMVNSYLSVSSPA
jgi:hypothetical protein